jgi:glycosidase
MVPIEFWIEARQELDKIKPVFMLAEWDTPEMHLAFDMTYDWAMHKLMNGVVKGDKSVKDIVKHFEFDNQKYTADSFRMQFTSNHDENTWNGTVYERLGEAAETFAVFTCLIKDMPLIYTRQEAGLDKRLEFFEKDLVEWKENPFQNLYSKLFHLKINNKALLNGVKASELNLLKSSIDHSVFTFTREKNKDKIFAVFNLSNKNIEFDLEGENLSGTYKNFFAGKIDTFSENENFNLNSWGYNVFVK